MLALLTSSPFGVDSPLLNPSNGFVDTLRSALPAPCRGLFVCSNPDVPELTDHFCGDVAAALEQADIPVTSWSVLDGRNAADASSLVAEAGLMVLAGGHVPTQNAWFRRIGLRQLLKGWQGVLVGISAGSMNNADIVYAQPEEPGESAMTEAERFLPGLGVTRVMLLPHYQKVRDNVLDGLRLFEDITYSDSRGRCFYAIPDGSYLLCDAGGDTLYGEAWQIEDGTCTQVCAEGERLRLKNAAGEAQA